MAKASILDSLDIITYSVHQKEIGLPAHVRECVAAEYGALPEPEKDTRKFRGGTNTRTVTFGEVHTRGWKCDRSPALQLLAVCVQLDAVAQSPANRGLIVRISADDLPCTAEKGNDSYVTIADWMSSRESVAQRKHDALKAVKERDEEDMTRRVPIPPNTSAKA
jgi:hypothetical protein